MPQQEGERRPALASLGAHLDGTAGAERVVELSVDAIAANPEQPRKFFDDAALKSLADSIKEHGLMQPIVVRDAGRPAAPGDAGAGRRYELIAGERRLRAHQVAGLKTIRAIVRTTADDKILVLALIENVQREDLSLLERARAFVQLKDERHGGNVEEAAAALHIARSVGFFLSRCASAPTNIQELIARDKLDVRAADFLVSLRKKIEKQHPEKVEAFDTEISAEAVTFGRLKEIHGRHFPDSKPKDAAAAADPKEKVVPAKEYGFWKDSIGVLHLTLTLSQPSDGVVKADQREAAAAALRFFRAAGFRHVKIEL